MHGLRQDLVLALRSFQKYPGVNGLAVLTLAVAIGSATVVFSVVHTALWRPLPYEAPERLVALFRHDIDRDERRNPTTPADFFDWRVESRTLEGLTAAHPFGPVLSGDGPSVRLAGLKATSSLFTLLGARPALGRVFDETDEARGEDARVVVLSHALWQRVLGGDRTVVGRRVRLDGADYEVIGVMPPSFFFPPFWATEAEFWTPLVFSPEDRSQRRAQFLRVFARLTPGSTLETARAELQLIAGRQRALHPETNAEAAINLEPLREPAVGARRLAYGVLLGAVGLVVLVACANTANLLLARALGREREMAVRLALGAGRARLVRQMLVESFLLAALATVTALCVSAGFLRAGSFVTASLPFPAEAGLDGRVLTFALGLSIATTFLFGVAPAVRASRAHFETELRRRLDRRGTALSSVIVVGEVAVSLALVMSAFVLLKNFVQLSHIDPGFRRERLLTLGLSLTGTAHTAPASQRILFEAAEESVRRLPGVEDATFVNHLPIGGDLWRTAFTVDGLDTATEGAPVAAHRTVGTRYFDTLGIAIITGRSFDARDREDTAPVVVVNETLAERFFPGRNPVGESLVLGGGERRATIVGVARNVKQWALIDPIRPEIYFPYRQNPSSDWLRSTLVVRSPPTLGPEHLEASVRSALAEVDPALPLTSGRTMEEILSGSLAEPRFRSTLMAVFAATALFLSLAGIYGVMAFGVRSRRREIGLRMALGASPARVSRLVLRDGLRLTGAGVLIGSTLALGIGHVSSALVPGTTGAAGVMLPSAAAAALVLFTGAAASFIPARQASALSPRRAIEEGA